MKSIVNSKDTAEVFYNHVHRLHGLGRKFFSFRNLTSTGNFCKELMCLLKVKLNLSTAFHPQTDKKSEMSFRILEEMLRCFDTYMQKDRDTFLPGLEFGYNNHIIDATNATLFFLEYAHHPVTISEFFHRDNIDISNVKTQKSIENIQYATEVAQASLGNTNAKMIDNHPVSKTDSSFRICDQVVVSTKNLNIKQGRTRKLTPMSIGPFEVIDVLGDGISYQWKFPKNMEKIHHTFHALLLKPYYGKHDTMSNERTSIANRIVIAKRQFIDRVLRHCVGKSKLE